MLTVLGILIDALIVVVYKLTLLGVALTVCVCAWFKLAVLVAAIKRWFHR